MYSNDGYHKVLSLMMSVSTMNGLSSYYDDLMFMYDEKLMGYSVSLVIEIDDLIDKGYNKEEIRDMINDSDFRKNDKELTEEEASYLKKEAYKLLNIRYNIYEEEKDKKLKKHLS